MPHVFNNLNVDSKLEQVQNSSQYSHNSEKHLPPSNGNLSTTLESPLFSNKNSAPFLLPSRGNLDTLLSVAATDTHEGMVDYKNKYKTAGNNNSIISSFAQRKNKNMGRTAM